MDADTVLQDLVALAQRVPELDLLQFKTLVSAEQYRRLYELVERYVASGGTVLDWGCGNGHMAYALSAMGYVTHAYSIEVAPPPLADLMPDVPFTVTSDGDVVGLPFESATFDAVVSVGVLEHVRETGGTEIGSLLEIRRILKPTGIFICYHLPNRYSYIDAVARLIPGAHHHRFRYTRQSATDLCASAGLRVMEIQRYAALPRNPWQVVPKAVGNSHGVAALWEKLDRWTGAIVSPVVQNYYFIASPNDLPERQPPDKPGPA